MTALIKSTDGSGWVEARVNDTVDCMGDEVTLTQQHIEDGYISAHKSDPWCSVDLSDCRLIERPFRVGDDFEWIYHGMEYARNNVIDKPWHRCRVMSQIEAHGMNEKENKHLYRHSSPLLRPVGGV